jgi:hypothetical protein
LQSNVILYCFDHLVSARRKNSWRAWRWHWSRKLKGINLNLSLHGMQWVYHGTDIPAEEKERTTLRGLFIKSCCWSLSVFQVLQDTSPVYIANNFIQSESQINCNKYILNDIWSIEAWPSLVLQCVLSNVTTQLGIGPKPILTDTTKNISSYYLNDLNLNR